MRTALRTRHYSPSTERVYVEWVRVGPSTQNQALAALLFLYREVLGTQLGWLDNVVRAKASPRLPVVLSREEVAGVLHRMRGPTALMARLMYGAGLRLIECCRLRVKDVDFDRREIAVRAGKGGRDRRTLLPSSLRNKLADHLRRVRRMHESDCKHGAGWVELPGRLDRKLPNAGRDWPWQWVFPATRAYLHSETGQRRRHHLHETVLQRAFREAVLASGIAKRATCHEALIRHAFARRRIRHPDDPGASRPPRREHDDGVHARTGPRGPGRVQPG